MSLLMFEKQVLANHKGRITIRRQQCFGCNHVLALEITSSDLDRTDEADYYVAKDCVWLAKEPQLLYTKKRWFGDFIKCPICGREGKLPIDKPLNWELIEKNKEKRNALPSS